MKRVYIDEKNISEYKDFIPSDLYETLFSENVLRLGMEFSGMPAGAILCKYGDDKKPAKLLSIYVIPEARRLGIGSGLILAAAKELAVRNKESLSFRFIGTEDRKTLIPFLSSVGCEVDVTDTPVGSVTLGEAAKELNSFFENAQEQGKAISELTNAEKNVFVKVLGKTADHYSKDYLSGKPESFVIMRDNYIKSVLAFSEEDEDTLSLDYAYSADPRDFAMLLKYAARRLSESYGEDVRIEMLLMNESSREIYGRMFGEPEMKVAVAEGTLSF